MKKGVVGWGLLVVGCWLGVVGCSTTKFVPDGDYLLDRVKVVSDSKEVHPNQVKDFVKLHTNSKLFSLFKIPLHTYSLAGSDTSRWQNRLFHNLGEAPVIYDSLQAETTREDLDIALHNMGFLHGYTTLQQNTAKKKMRLRYTLHPGDAYYIRNINYDIKDTIIRNIIQSEAASERLINEGVRFDVDILDAERKRITNRLLNMGYYRFNKEFISYLADTLANSRMVDVTMVLDLYRANMRMTEVTHPRYTIGKVTYSSPQDHLHLRESVLDENTSFKSGDAYSDDALRSTYNNFGRLQAVKYTNITISERPDTILDCDIQINTGKPSTISFQPEGTNTAGDLGAAGKLGYENRNMFRGSELFSIEARLAYEHIKNLEGYSGHHYWEYGMEAKLTFPRFLIPFLNKKTQRQYIATSDLSVSYNRQDRPEFHRRVFSGGWRYRWSKPKGDLSYRLDMLNLNFVSMPWISDTFRKEYLEDETSKNAILKYNYQDLFIMNLGFGLSYNDGRNAFKVNLETAGNLLRGLSSLFSWNKNEDGQYSFLNIAYAQYAKGDVDYTHNFSLDKNNTIVLHAALGVAYPYGNSTILPFEKRYFSGGANSVRGWSVRSLGPGSYTGADGKINFINQTGDMKLDINAEYRTYLFWKFNGALFIDAGNIWTLREYDDQPGGQFRLNKFLSQMAASYGVGVRLNFDYFILRFDMAMKAINPAYETSDKQHFPILHHDLGRDFTFHFAVGMPF